MRKNTAGFTLIEIIVVMSIIGLLAGLLLPALASAREKARQAVCRSNLKQLGTAFTHFAEDNNMYLPVAVQQDESLGTVYYTDLLAVPYVVLGPVTLKTRTDQITYAVNLRTNNKLNGIFYCPCCGDHTTPSYGMNAVDDTQVIDTTDTSKKGSHPYGLTRVMRSQGGQTTAAPVSVNEASNPASTICLVDTKAGTDFWHAGEGVQVDPTKAFDISQFTTVDLRHTYRFCALFVDGHSDFVLSDRATDWSVFKPPL